MKFAKVLGFGLLVVALVVVGCGQDGGKPSDTKTDTAGKGGKETEHAHGKGPNGGVVFDLGKYHAEFTVDHDKKECKVLMLGMDEKTPKAVACKELTGNTKETKTKEGRGVEPISIKWGQTGGTV